MQAYNALLWSGHARFRQRDPEKWYYADASGDKISGGLFKTSKNLTLVTIDEAGHMSPHDQPEAVLQLMRAWTGQAGASAGQGKPFFKDFQHAV